VMSFLRSRGCTRMFGNPGSTELPLFRDFPEDFHYILALQEAVAVGMADGYAQATAKPTCVNLHSAAGTGNAMGAIFTAWCNRTPLIIIAGQQARSLLLHDPFLMSHHATQLVQPYVKYAVEPARARDVPQAIARAWFHATTHPQGPVFISVPVDDWDQPAQPVPERPAITTPPAGDIAELVTAFRQAKRPALVVGGEVDRDGAWGAVVRFAQQMDLDVWQAPLEGRMGFPQNHPNFLGILPSEPSAVRTKLAPNDLVVTLGTRAFNYHFEGSGPPVVPGTELILVGVDPDHGAAASCGRTVFGSIGATLWTLLDALASEKLLRPTQRERTATGVPAFQGSTITLPMILAALQEVRPHDSLIVEEAATARPQLPHHLPIDQPNSFFTCASGALGFGLPGAVGVALAQPHRKTIAIVGDGASLYTIQALFSAKREAANVTFIILNNRRYAALDMVAPLFGLTHVPGTDLEGIDFVGLAKAQGVPAERASAPEKLRAAVKKAMTAEGPYLLDVILN